MELCRVTSAPPRLVAHLTLVHDVAAKLIAQVHDAFPSVAIDDSDVLFGAATHDLGKAANPQELVEPGKSHETHGVAVLEALGVSKQRSRFAFTHGNWEDDSTVQLEDLLVSLADNCRKGKRVAELELRVVKEIASETAKPDWEVFASLDDILQELGADADERLAWQAQFPPA